MTGSARRREIEYLIRVLGEVLPGHGLSPADIVFTYAGVRPLPRTAGIVAGAISRDHKLHRFAATSAQLMTVYALVGGKWPTYRAAQKRWPGRCLRSSACCAAGRQQTCRSAAAATGPLWCVSIGRGPDIFTRRHPAAR